MYFFKIPFRPLPCTNDWHKRKNCINKKSNHCKLRWIKKMDNTIQILSELFPAKYHKYHLVETINGISIQTLSFYYYLIPFFLLTTLFYYFLLWEFNNWKIDFKISFSPLAFLLSSTVIIVASWESLTLSIKDDSRWLVSLTVIWFIVV